MVQSTAFNRIFTLNKKEIKISEKDTSLNKENTHELGDKLYIGSDVKNVDNIETIINNKINPNAKLDCP